MFLKDKVKPVLHMCRKVPFPLQGKLKEVLARTEKPKVIKKFDEPPTG